MHPGLQSQDEFRRLCTLLPVRNRFLPSATPAHLSATSVSADTANLKRNMNFVCKGVTWLVIGTSFVLFRFIHADQL